VRSKGWAVRDLRRKVDALSCEMLGGRKNCKGGRGVQKMNQQEVGWGAS